MEHSSTRTISSVIGGSTLTAPLLRIFTLSMMRLLLNVKLLQLMPWENTEHLPNTLLLLLLLVTILPALMKVLEPMKKKDAEVADLETGETTDVDVVSLTHIRGLLLCKPKMCSLNEKTEGMLSIQKARASLLWTSGVQRRSWVMQPSVQLQDGLLVWIAQCPTIDTTPLITSWGTRTLSTDS